MRCYNSQNSLLKYAPPSRKALLLGGAALLMSLLFYILEIASKPLLAYEDIETLRSMAQIMETSFMALCIACVFMGLLLIAIALILYASESDCTKIKYQVIKGLCDYRFGNPLKLKDGEKLPKVKVKEIQGQVGIYELTVYASPSSVEEIEDVATNISSVLNGKYERYAITQGDVDLACNFVRYRLEDVTIDRSMIVNNVADLKPEDPTKFIIQKGTYIDLTSSGSMLVAGKTRSGKTTGIISILLQALLYGPDRYGSEILIIDPKQAELSRLPYVVTLDENDEAREILSRIETFENKIKQRQAVLNEISEKTGDAVKWWDFGFHPSFLFIDEYVSCRSAFPKRASKDDSKYCLQTFDDLLKRITTMGASAGCFVIISIAEASVDEGGLPSMLKSAMSTKILFRPTLTEARLIWDSEKLKNILDRQYGPGDAWFTSTDGINDDVKFVHFPKMDFKVYEELGKLLQKYYANEHENSKGINKNDNRTCSKKVD